MKEEERACGTEAIPNNDQEFSKPMKYIKLIDLRSTKISERINIKHVQIYHVLNVNSYQFKTLNPKNYPSKGKAK